MLRHVAALLKACIRSYDAAARLGGDEFLLILPHASRTETARIAQRLLDVCKSTPLIMSEVGILPVRMSLGLAAYPEDGDHPQRLLAAADKSLYEAKRSGHGVRVDLGPSAQLPSDDSLGLDVLAALVDTVGRKDRYTLDHSDQVSTFACMLGTKLGLSTEAIRTLRRAGLLHDVGKIGVPDEVLRKPGRLTESEWALMRQHVVLSTRLVKTLIRDPDLVAAVAHHHERWDGTGYPGGLSGTDVPLLGRIMIIADAVSAMLSDRPYRSGLTPSAVVREMRRQAGVQFDPSLVEPFIAAFTATTSESSAA